MMMMKYFSILCRTDFIFPAFLFIEKKTILKKDAAIFSETLVEVSP
jgi:cytochrome b subunit of formate dehydrogenase